MREGVQGESDEVLNYFPPSEAAMIREEAELCEMSVNAMVADFAKVGYKTCMDAFLKNEPNLGQSGLNYTPDNAAE